MFKRFLRIAFVTLAVVTCGRESRLTAPVLRPGVPHLASAMGSDSVSGATIATNQDDYMPGEVVHLSGSGWAPGETVKLDMTEQPDTHPDVADEIKADDSGAFSMHFYDVQEHDLGVTFTLTAIGQTSGSKAVVVFTDGNTSIASAVFTPTSPSPSQPFDVIVSVTITTSGGTKPWKSTKWSIDGGTSTCVNTTDHTSGGAFSETLAGIVAPATPGSHTLNVKLQMDDACTSDVPSGGGTYAFTVTGKTSATVSLSNMSQTYSASPLTPTATTTPAGLTIDWTGAPQTNVGSYPVTATINDATYEGTGSGTFTIGPKSVTALVTAANKPYDGSTTATIATCTLSGVESVDAADVTCAAGAGAFATAGAGDGKTVTATGITLSGTKAGNYALTSTSATTAANIGKVNATCAVSGFTGPYDAGAHGASGTCTGVDAGGAASGGSLDLGASYTNAPGGTANWTFTGGANYNDQSGSVAIAINKLNATCAITGYTGPYDAAAHGASGSCTGDGSLNLGASFTNAPGGTANWTFTGGDNYNDQSGSAAIVINKADASCTINGYTGPYDAAAHGASGACTGLDAGSAAAGSTMNLGASFTNYPGGTVNWTFSGGTNYNDQNGAAAIVINKANATCNVSGYTGTYDAAAHGASGSCTGADAGGAASGGSLDLGASFTDVAGGTANWSFTGGTNYNNQNGSVAIVINKAASTTTVTCPTSVTYNTLPQTPCTATVSGIGTGITQAVTWTYTNNTAAGTATATAAYAGDLNHNVSNDTKTFAITPRAATVNYIGQLMWVTSGTSTTTAQVTLTASMQDPSGVGLAGATVSFIDEGTGQVLASNVAVSPVAGSAGSGTANKVVTLSSGQYGSESYVILVKLTGNYDNSTQPGTDKTATVVVSKLAATSETIGGGTVANLAGKAGMYGVTASGTTTYSVGLKYNKAGTNPQGKISLSIEQADGSTIYVQSNSISSMSATGKDVTIYTKASIYRIDNAGVMTTIEGGITLRMDAHDGGNTGDTVGFTVLSSKDSMLYYSNNWNYDTVAKIWKTLSQTLATGGIQIN